MNSNLTRFLKMDDAQIAYRFDGPDNAPVVLLSNSLMTNFSMWDITIPYWHDRFRVLRYDIRGQGHSDTSVGSYSMAQLSGDVLKMLDLLQIDKVNFVGLSLGGMIGQQFAIDHQDRLHSLVLCNTACEMPPPDLWNRCREIVLHEGMAGIAKDTLRYWFQPSFLRSNKQYPDLFREMILQNNIEGYIACITAIRDMNHAQMLFKIKCPTLIIAGKRDVMCTVHQARALNRFIEKSRLIILKDAAHISNIERPSEFAHAIMAFILEQGHTGMLSG